MDYPFILSTALLDNCSLSNVPYSCYHGYSCTGRDMLDMLDIYWTRYRICWTCIVDSASQEGLDASVPVVRLKPSPVTTGLNWTGVLHQGDRSLHIKSNAGHAMDHTQALIKICRWVAYANAALIGGRTLALTCR